VGPVASFDPESARTSYKARAVSGPRRRIAHRDRPPLPRLCRFPKASVEKTADVFRVRLQTYPFDPDFRVQALIDVSPSAQILSEVLSYDFGPAKP